MTDKEKAKEYYRKLKPFELCTGAEAEAGMKGYLVGLKAGRKESKKEIAELKAQLSNLCEWKGDISSVLADVDNGKYKSNEHQAFVDLYLILNGVHMDILNVLKMDVL